MYLTKLTPTNIFRKFSRGNIDIDDTTTIIDNPTVRKYL